MLACLTFSLFFLLTVEISGDGCRVWQSGSKFGQKSIGILQQLGIFTDGVFVRKWVL